MKLRRANHSRCAAFTMVEIALCLAIIGFSLVAIVGILPIGMSVQRDNREETIINQDATYLLEAIRSGAQGVDMLTNYVEYIVVYSQGLDANGLPSGALRTTVFTNPVANPNLPPPPPNPGPALRLDNGQQIVGVLSIPRYEDRANQSGQSVTLSNYVVAVMRAISGPATDKGTNLTSRDFAFHYRLITEISPANLPAIQAFNWNQTGMTADQKEALTNQWRTLVNTASNLHEIRLLFRYPLLRGLDPDTGGVRTGKGRQVYRALAGGALVRTNVPFPQFFLSPASYTKVNFP